MTKKIMKTAGPKVYNHEHCQTEDNIKYTKKKKMLDKKNA